MNADQEWAKLLTGGEGYLVPHFWNQEVPSVSLRTKITLETDHKPLTAIFGSKKGVPAMAAAKLQRWAIQLALYNYKIKFRPTQVHANANGLSRLPLDVGELESNYLISLNKRSGAYFLHGLHPPTVKQDRAFIRGPALISYHLFQRYCGPMTFSDCGEPTWYLSASSRRPPTKFAMQISWSAKDSLEQSVGLLSSIWWSKRQSLTSVKEHSLDKLIARQTADRSTQILQLSSECM